MSYCSLKLEYESSLRPSCMQSIQIAGPWTINLTTLGSHNMHTFTTAPFVVSSPLLSRLTTTHTGYNKSNVISDTQSNTIHRPTLPRSVRHPLVFLFSPLASVNVVRCVPHLPLTPWPVVLPQVCADKYVIRPHPANIEVRRTG